MPLGVAVEAFFVIFSYDFNSYMNTYGYFLCAKSKENQSVYILLHSLYSLMIDKRGNGDKVRFYL